MQDADTPKAPQRGRPATGQALSSTERSRKRRNTLRTAGNLHITADITPQAAAALAKLRRAGLTIDEAVSRALVAAATTPTV